VGAEYREIGGVDRVLHEPSRLILVALLSGAESADFVFLQRETGLTKGNMSAHLVKLEQVGYVEIEKSFRGKTPRTVVRLTDSGRSAFRSYREQMRRVVDSLPD
jgi:DNA-binding MarR family transcriptional regulator